MAVQFTVVKVHRMVGEKSLVDAVCESTETKPTDIYAGGSFCIEPDTGDIYMLASAGWNKVSD